MTSDTRDYIYKHRRAFILFSIFFVLLIASVLMVVISNSYNNQLVQGIGLGILFYNCLYGIIIVSCFHCCPHKCKDPDYEELMD